MIIGVSGRNGSGKGALLEDLAGRGFTIFSLSDVLRNQLSEQGLAETRERMIATGNALRRERGPGALASVLTQELEKDIHYGIDSIRHPAEVDVLATTTSEFRLIWVEAPIELRFERIRHRARPGDPDTVAELARLENLERGGADTASQQLDAVRARADFVVANESGLDVLSASLDPILTSMGFEADA
ncbi:MAG: AAA family ATPase [Myxococcota bacterium]|nr:AAA family ATPase [Myxococcota bacterium]